MKCPLTLQIDVRDDDEMRSVATDCLEEECAWWDCTLDRCHLQSISLRLDSVWRELAGIKDRLPQARQSYSKGGTE